MIEQPKQINDQNKKKQAKQKNELMNEHVAALLFDLYLLEQEETCVRIEKTSGDSSNFCPPHHH